MDQERQDYDDGLPIAGAWRARERLAVVVPTLLIGAALTGTWSLTELPGPLAQRAWVWAMILAGPVFALTHGVPVGCAPVALLVAPAILAHPVRPNVWTGVATVAALALWILTGWATAVVIVWGG